VLNPKPPRIGRNQAALMYLFAGLAVLFFLLLPLLCGARYHYLLWSEGFSERSFAHGFLAGRYEKQAETPKPLWSLFWLLANTPNQLYVVIALLVGGLFLVYQQFSFGLTKTVLPGILAFVLTVFTSKDVLVLFLNGNWTIPFMLLGVLALLALSRGRYVQAAVFIGLAGLIRPEAWLLTLFLIAHVKHSSGRVPWSCYAPLAAPLLWALYDHRLSGDWLFSLRSTANYARLTGLPGTSFLSFWPYLVSDIAASTGVVVLIYALAGIVLRAINLSRKRGERGLPAIVLDPLFGITLLPLTGAWIMSITGNLVIMRRFYFLSISLLALYAVLVPFELARLARIARRNRFKAGILLPLVLFGVVRAPAIIENGHDDLRTAEVKMTTLQGLARKLLSMSATAAHDSGPGSVLDGYRSILIPMRRYAILRAFTNDSIARKFVSYREVSLGATDILNQAWQAGLAPPVGAADSAPNQTLDVKVLGGYLPALAVWVAGDEVGYFSAFALDEPFFAFDMHNLLRKDYVTKGHIAFHIIDATPDSLGLLYDVRPASSLTATTVVGAQ
jgi:hypothetical protein